MKVLRTIAAILWQKKLTMLIYLAIPVLMAALFGPMMATENASFEEVRVNFAVQNYDRSPLSIRLEEIMADEHTRVELPEDETAFQNELFYGGIEYLLVIPEGFFTEQLDWYASGADEAAAGSLPKLQRTRNAEATSMNLELLIERYLQQIALSLAADPTLSDTELAGSIGDQLVQHNEVEIHSTRGAWTGAMDFYYRFVSFGMLSTVFFLVTLISMTMNDPNVLPRQTLSPVSRGRLNLETTLSSIVISSGAVLIYFLVGLLMFGERVFSEFGLIANLNMVLFSYVSLGISFFIANFITNEEAMSVVGNVLPLFFAFFGGVFVNVSILGPPVSHVAPFTPTFWYTSSLDLMSEQGTMNALVRPELVRNILVLLVYGTVFILLSVAVAFSRGRRGSKAIRTKARYG